MNDAKLKALKGSIAKWKAIVAGKARDRGAKNCPLCKLFYEDDDFYSEVKCDGCPILAHTGHHGCHGTPYMDDWFDSGGFANEGKYTRQQIAAAKKELVFLESLLP